MPAILLLFHTEIFSLRMIQEAVVVALFLMVAVLSEFKPYSMFIDGGIAAQGRGGTEFVHSIAAAGLAVPYKSIRNNFGSGRIGAEQLPRWQVVADEFQFVTVRT